MIILFDGLNILCNVASYNQEETAEGTLKEACAILELVCPDINTRPENYTPVFVWDPTKHTSNHQETVVNARKVIFPEYKANRKQKHAKIVEAVGQKDYVKQYLELFGINNIEQQGLEADDLIAFICQISRTAPIVIVSEDKDFLQLVNKRVSVIRQSTWIADHNFKQHVGMTPTQYLDWKIIAGDPSDNIPPIKSKASGLQWLQQGAHHSNLTPEEKAVYHRNKKLIELNLWKHRGAVRPEIWRTAKRKWRNIRPAQ